MAEKLNPIEEAKDLLIDACLDFQYFFNGDCRDNNKFMQGLTKIVTAVKFLEDKAFFERCGEES